MTITEVLARNTDRWMKIPGVTGTGEGRLHGKPCVVIFVERNTPAIRKQLPTSIDGFRVQIRAVGTIEARSR
ncbi:MAG: hypothetical protein JSS75_11790 [Bacteroidetes bacterium]|nr:hypothetical protein [Bacteroidota bacterium]